MLVQGELCLGYTISAKCLCVATAKTSAAPLCKCVACTCEAMHDNKLHNLVRVIKCKNVSFRSSPSRGQSPATKPVDADHANRDGSAPSDTYCLKGLTTCIGKEMKEIQSEGSPRFGRLITIKQAICKSSIAEACLGLRPCFDGGKSRHLERS